MEESAGGVVVVMAESAAGAVAAVSLAAPVVAVSSAFFWQADRLAARAAATATEVRIRSFMSRLPWRKIPRQEGAYTLP
jgi:hypothetical protein